MNGAERDEVIEVAAYWATRLDSDECSPADRAAFEKWRAKVPEHAAAFEKVEASLSAVYRQIDDPDLMAYAAQVTTGAPRRVWSDIWAGLAGVAASIVLIAVAAFIASLAFTPEDAVLKDTIPENTAGLAEGAEVYRTQVGERSTVTLADGSEVTLNTDTGLRVEFSARERRLQLLRGQAFFKVEKDATRPFVVEAGHKRVVAIGTAFDVRFDTADQVQITLVEGRIAVDNRIDKGLPDALAEAAPRIELSPGQQMLAALDARPSVIEADIEKVTSWSEGRIVFDNDRLRDAVAEVNRYTATPIVLGEDSRLDAIRVGGVFRTGRQETFLLALETLHPIGIEKHAGATRLVWCE